MVVLYAFGKKAIAECDRCGFQYPLKVLRELIVKTHKTNILVCPTCWEPDQPQLLLGMYPITDPQALRNPRPDTTLGPGGSRDIWWGWNPVGFNNPLGLSGLVSTLVATGGVGTVTVEIT